jgi:DNA-binding HxlR family transcriptional regulator
MQTAEHQCFCPIEGIIDVISKKWSLLIINTLGNFRVLRFRDIEKRLKGISPKTLSDTLSKLRTAGLIERESFNEIPPRVEYQLSKDGLEFRSAILPLIKWAAKREGWNPQFCPSNCDLHSSMNDECSCPNRSV